MSDPELFADLARLRAVSLLYCITLVRLITFKSAIFARFGQDFVLHAISEVGVLFVLA